MNRIIGIITKTKFKFILIVRALQTRISRPQKDNGPLSPIKATINSIPRTLVSGMIKLKLKNMLLYVLINKIDLSNQRNQILNAPMDGLQRHKWTVFVIN